MITADEESLYSALTGSGAMQTNPTEFLRGLFHADDTTFGGVALDGWQFFFDNPIDYDVNSGNFIVLAGASNAAGIVARGEFDGLVNQFVLVLGSSAVGNINPSAGTWKLHYTEGNAAGSVVVHLEGTIHDLSP